MSTAPPPLRHRSLTPDLARGAAMFGVVMANAATYAMSHGYFALDGVLRFLGVLLLEGRSWPMFALMFGFGIATMLASLGRRGHDRATAMRTVRRRAWWLWVIGAVQCTLWFGFDVLTQYAGSALLVLLLVHARVRTWWIIGILTALVIPVGGGVGIGLMSGFGFEGTTLTSSYWVAMGERAVAAAVGPFLAVLTGLVLAPMIVGLAHQRAGSLVEPGRFVRMHRIVGFGGLAVGLLGGLPWAWVVAGAVDGGSVFISAAFALHAVTGMVQGAAYVSLLALLAVRWREQPRGVAMVVAVVGQRSLTVYVLHGLLLSFALEPWALDLAAHSLTLVYAIGLATWLVCVGVAWLLHRAGRPGPLDAWLRRMTYRKLPPLSQPAAPEVPSAAGAAPSAAPA